MKLSYAIELTTNGVKTVDDVRPGSDAFFRFAAVTRRARVATVNDMQPRSVRLLVVTAAAVFDPTLLLGEPTREQRAAQDLSRPDRFEPE